MSEASVFKNKNLYIIFGVTLIAMMGVASITPAFPDIIRYFDISPQQVGGLIVAFTLPGIFLTPFTGILADRYGRKIVLIPSLFLFGIAGFACMFTKDFYWLMVLRFLQGIGASSLSSMNITLVGDLFEGKQRTSVMGYNASVLSIATASYPALGGVIAIWGWQYIFALPLLAIPLGFVVMRGLNIQKPSGNMHLRTYFGRVWQTINQRTVWGLLLVNFILFIILYGTYLTYFPLMMEHRMGSDSYHIGLMMSLMSVTTAIMSSQLGRLNRLLGQKRQLIIGSIGYFTASILMLFANDYLSLALAVVVFGFGHGITIPSIQNMMVGFAAINERAAFMSLNSMVLRGGQTAGPLLVGTIYAFSGLNATFLTGAVMAVIMLVLIYLMVQVKKSEG
ncbi:MFS transporter [Draconibacterium sp. IB214405]|uniref:MFS transporter n=1 Tax=Draconibacterium sp. IB214405 TaxID=3097352 RepID=UPI002A1222D2|nr:MFS transporter [Draconibacterium sp. IB214405]MDX8341362.1 MFS transporter [Draconibacterium sp. IB214405]